MVVNVDSSSSQPAANQTPVSSPSFLRKSALANAYTIEDVERISPNAQEDGLRTALVTA